MRTDIEIPSVSTFTKSKNGKDVSLRYYAISDIVRISFGKKHLIVKRSFFATIRLTISKSADEIAILNKNNIIQKKLLFNFLYFARLHRIMYLRSKYSL